MCMDDVIGNPRLPGTDDVMGKTPTLGKDDVIIGDPQEHPKETMSPSSFASSASRAGFGSRSMTSP